MWPVTLLAAAHKVRASETSYERKKWKDRMFLDWATSSNPLDVYCTSSTKCFSCTPGSHLLCAFGIKFWADWKVISIRKESHIEQFISTELEDCEGWWLSSCNAQWQSIGSSSQDSWYNSNAFKLPLCLDHNINYACLKDMLAWYYVILGTFFWVMHSLGSTCIHEYVMVYVPTWSFRCTCLD